MYLHKYIICVRAMMCSSQHLDLWHGTHPYSGNLHHPGRVVFSSHTSSKVEEPQYRSSREG